MREARGLSLLSMVIVLAAASPGRSMDRFSPAGVEEDIRFGFAVAQDGKRALVGAPFEGEGAVRAGAAYVYEYDGTGWTELQRLAVPDATRLGESASFHGELALVGAPRTDPGGRAYVFRDGGAGFSLEQTLAPGAGELGAFGSSVAIAGDRALVGDPGSSISDGGVVHVFRYASGAWTEIQRLVGSAPTSGFGGIVRLDGERAFVTSRARVDSGLEGRIHVYEWNGEQYVEVQVLGLSDPSAGASSMAVDGRTLVVGSRGEVFLFERRRGLWAETQVLDPPPFAGVFPFGQSVAVSGDAVLVGGEDEFFEGRVFLYRRSLGEWVFEASIEAFDEFRLRDNGDFGFFVTLEDGLGLIGDPGWGGFLKSIGAVYSIDAGSPGRKLIGDDTGSSDFLGNGIGVSRSTLMVGSSQVRSPGEVEVFSRRGFGWTQTQTLVPFGSSFADGDLFGNEIAVSGSLALVAADHDDEQGNNAGAVYVFRREQDTWQGVQKLLPPASSALFFGASMALSGRTAVIGCGFCDQTESNDGAAFVYEWDGETFALQALLDPDAPVPQAALGTSVAIEGNLAVVGAPGDSGDGPATGAAYVFRRRHGVWAQEARLVDPEGEQGESFGATVAVSRGRVAVGAPSKEGTTPTQGAVFVFERGRSGWSLEQTLRPDDPESASFLGYRLALSGDTLIAGARRWREVASEPGAVLRFERRPGGDWELAEVHLPSDHGQRVLFGENIALRSGEAYISAQSEDFSDTLSGVLYIVRGNNRCGLLGVEVLPLLAWSLWRRRRSRLRRSA